MKKILTNILLPFQKFSKGMLVILTFNLLLVLSVFIFDSCRKASYEKSGEGLANARFVAALEKNKSTIGNISFSASKNKTTVARAVAPPDDELIVYMQFPDAVNPETETVFQNIHSMDGLVDLIHEAKATLQYEPNSTNTDYPLSLPLETITNSLAPLIIESKEYLYSKGFTEQDIQQMIAEEGAAEIDLIPFVMALTSVENMQPTVKRRSGFLVNSLAARTITWSDAAACAVAALLGDFAGFAYGSTASVWSVGAMKAAFKAVAKKALGPVGVAIAVAEFGLCLTGVYLDH